MDKFQKITSSDGSEKRRYVVSQDEFPYLALQLYREFGLEWISRFDVFHGENVVVVSKPSDAEVAQLKVLGSALAFNLLSK
jgi:hypothetical protein